MKAGRELDALIAEKVMGFQRVEFLRDMLPWTFYLHEDRDVVVAFQSKLAEFKPSTNIADAWEVVRKMGMVLIENSGEAFGQADEWNVQFVGHDKEGKPHWVSESAETVEIAICLAALKAKGGDA